MHRADLSPGGFVDRERLGRVAGDHAHDGARHLPALIDHDVQPARPVGRGLGRATSGGRPSAGGVLRRSRRGNLHQQRWCNEPDCGQNADSGAPGRPALGKDHVEPLASMATPFGVSRVDMPLQIYHQRLGSRSHLVKN